MGIRKLLIANRGEIVSRVIRTARAMDIATVAVFSDADADLPFVGEADEAVRLPGTAPADTYLDRAAVIAAARATGADAVHPGYGFLSENAQFARDCDTAGLTFVGPRPDAIDAMGSKTAAKDLMAAAGVPVLPGAVFASGGEPDPAELRTAAEAIGFPVLVKAAFGGGGRGMRIVHDIAGVVEAVSSARREAASAFGDGTVFLERYVTSPRHIEVQILGDRFGTVAHLFERECSIQRRYQKIIEEAPSAAVTDELRSALCEAAVAAGRAIGYTGAGTVEFVLDSAGEFYFLEVNTRLQVEHPVTEMITGIDLVKAQLEIAAGHPLPADVLRATISGHAIEARLYAEDVAAGYLPASGQVHTFEVPSGDGLRVDTGYASGTAVSTFYDSMLAKIIGYGQTRQDARRVVSGALSNARLHGVATNRELLVGVLRHTDFIAGTIDTGFLQRHDLAELCPPPQGQRRQVHALAAALADQASRRQGATVLATMPSGWRNNPSGAQRAEYEVAGERVEVHYRFGRDGLKAAVDGTDLGPVLLHAATPTSVDLEMAGVRRNVQVLRIGEAVFVDSRLGHDRLAELPRFPDQEAATAAGSLRAPMPGTVVRVDVSVGDLVPAGSPILAIEAMKMEHAVHAPTHGVVREILIAVGAQVDGGSVLVVLEESDI